MHCGRVSNLMSAYIDRELSGVEMLQIRRHLEECSGCSAEHEALHGVKSLLASAPLIAAHADPAAAVMRRWQERRAQASAPAARWDWRRFQGWGGWQRCSLAFTSVGLALALIGTGLALRKPTYPDAVAANVLPALAQAEAGLAQPEWLLEPRFVSWPAEESWQSVYRSRGPSRAWWATSGHGASPMPVADVHGPSPYFGR